MIRRKRQPILLEIAFRRRYTGCMGENDSSLIRRVRDPSDAESWREFVALYEPLLLRYVRSHGLTEQDARDVEQEIFVSLICHLPEFELDPSRGQFRTWLWQVTRNTVADWAPFAEKRPVRLEGSNS